MTRDIEATQPYWLAGCPEAPNHDLEVRDKYTGEVVTRVAMADADAIERAIAAASAAAPAMRRLASYQRQDILLHCVRRLTEEREFLAQMLRVEGGKALAHARGEVARLIDTFRIAAEESVRIGGEVLPLDITARAADYRGMWRRVPIGPCSFITPFNFPLNLAAHKIAPAIAAGCPFVLKPGPRTPLGALFLGSILAETALPPGAFSIVPCSIAAAAPLVEDDRLNLLSFTGSQRVGWDMKARAGRKKVVLELGGNAACVVDADADLEDAAARITIGGFYHAGQSCIGVQRVLIHRDVYEETKALLVAAANAVVTGDPREEETFLGPMIDAREAERVESWIRAAEAAGATVLCGGTRDGAMVTATILEGVPKDQAAWCSEIFGPVIVLRPFASFDEALAEVNDSPFGLQAGIFTRDIYKAHRAWDELEVGGVIIGDIPSWRVDHMPYGGVKESGFGREGLRYAIEDMTEIRLMVLRTPPSERG